MSVLVDNEQTKLIANALDRASTACLALGLIGPAAAFIYRVPGAPAASAPYIISGSVFWLVAALLLHLGAQRILRRLI